MKKQAIYQRIEEYLLSRIESGEYPVGCQIPTEFELCDLFSASKATVNQALNDLVHMGLISRRPGRGSFVRLRMTEETAYRNFLHLTGCHASHPDRYELVDHTLIAGDGNEEIVIPGYSDFPAHCIVRRCFRGDRMIGVEKAYIPVAVMPCLDMHSIEIPISEYFSSVAILQAQSRQTSIRIIQDDVSDPVLPGNHGMPVLLLEQQCRGSCGSFIYYLASWYVFDQYQYSIIARHQPPLAQSAGDRRHVLYSEIEGFIRQRIQSGEWEIGHQIPTEMEMCSQFGVSRMTVRRAMGNLVKNGMVRRIQKVGTFVSASSEPAMLDVRARFCAPDADTREKKTRLQSYEILPAMNEPTIMQMLCLGGDEFIYRIILMQVIDGEPFQLTRIYLPATLIPTLDVRFVEQGLMDYIERTHSLAAAWQFIHVGVEPADHATTPRLDMTMLALSDKAIPFAVEKHSCMGENHHVSIEEKAVVSVHPHKGGRQ